MKIGIVNFSCVYAFLTHVTHTIHCPNIFFRSSVLYNDNPIHVSLIKQMQILVGHVQYGCAHSCHSLRTWWQFFWIFLLNAPLFVDCANLCKNINEFVIRDAFWLIICEYYGCHYKVIVVVYSPRVWKEIASTSDSTGMCNDSMRNCTFGFDLGLSAVAWRWTFLSENRMFDIVYANGIH